MIKPIIHIPGAKFRLVNKMLPLIPKHITYVEAFGGSACLLLNKPPSPIEVYNDVDCDLVTFFRVVQDPQQVKMLERKLYWTLFSRQEWGELRKALKGGMLEGVDRAYAFYVVIWQSFNCKGDHWKYGLHNKPTKPCVDFSYITQRLSKVIIENSDYKLILAKYDAPDTFFYLDPPYYPDSIRAFDHYRFMFTKEDYDEFFELVIQLKGKVMISGYPHPVYQKLEQAGWKRYDFEVFCNTENPRKMKNPTRSRRIESLWLSYGGE